MIKLSFYISTEMQKTYSYLFLHLAALKIVYWIAVKLLNLILCAKGTF